MVWMHGFNDSPVEHRDTERRRRALPIRKMLKLQGLWKDCIAKRRAIAATVFSPPRPGSQAQESVDGQVQDVSSERCT